MINVKDYGAYGDGGHDDTTAIQNAINFAKSQSFPSGGGVYQISVYFPAGFYYITAPINITNSVGVWLVGDGGRYISTSIIGVTGGTIFDFSGSSVSGCENFTFVSNSSNGTNRSTIGIQFALTSNGGLNCGLRNCYFQLQDFPNANNGFGSIGVLAVRADEFFMSDCLVRANLPVLLSNTTSLLDVGANFTVTSRYQTLSSGTGSMGVINIQSAYLQNYEKRQPALILNGVNSLNFHGYLSRLSAANGTNETAILCNQFTTNLRIHATIESFSQIAKVTRSGFEMNEFKVVLSNVTSPSTPIVDVTGCTVKGLNLSVSLPVVSERGNRYVLYYSPDANPNTPAAGYITNSEISCYDVLSNQYIISPNLLKNAANVVFNTVVPFEKKGGRLKQLSNVKVSAGTIGSISPAIAIQFTQADNSSSTNGRGGYYRIWIDGVIQAGSYGSSYNAVLSFQAQLIVSQNYLGTLSLPSATVIILDKSVTNPAYIDINSVLVDISFSNRIGSVTVTPRVFGSSIGEPIYYEGITEIQSDFLVNDSVPL